MTIIKIKNISIILIKCRMKNDKIKMFSKNIEDLKIIFLVIMHVKLILDLRFTYFLKDNSNDFKIIRRV